MCAQEEPRETTILKDEILVDLKAWMLPGPRQKESTIPLGSEKSKAPWHRKERHPAAANNLRDDRAYHRS
jgi:hypothetical protein